MNLRIDLESDTNRNKIIKLICDEYKLNPRVSTNITNIKLFLGPLSLDKILSRANTLESANALIVKLYGDSVKLNSKSISEDLNSTKNYMLRVINTPGDNDANIKAEYAETFKEPFGDSNAGSILNLPLPERIETVKYLNYQSLFRDEYIMIDSRYQNKVNPDATKMLFSLIGTTKSKSDHGGVIVGSNIKNIVEIEVYPFTIPYKPAYATFYNKITMTINEWLASSFEAYEGGQFHFSFDIDHIDNNLIYLRPINSIYSFSNPVNYVDDFSLSFGAVFPKIEFDPDRMYPKKIDYTNPYGLIIFEAPHNLVTGDLVYITGFDTDDPAKDVVLINEINRLKGHNIVKKDNYSFIINTDFTSLHREIPIGSGYYPIDNFKQDVIVYFASKRVQIQMRLRYLTSYSD